MTEDGVYLSAEDKTITNSYKYCPILVGFDGKFVEKCANIAWTSYISSACMRQIGEKWYLDYGDTTYYIKSGIDKLGNGNNSYYKGMYYSYNRQSLAPYYLTLGDDPYYQEACLNINWSYLGTINNLAEPVTKTAAQSMKITYEITNEGGN